MIPPPDKWIIRLASWLRALGPYAAIELLVPGGSLIVLSMWAIRHRAWLAARARVFKHIRFPPAAALRHEDFAASSRRTAAE